MSQQMTREEFEKRTQKSRDFLKLCEMPEFKNTLVEFFDQLAEALHNESVLSYPVDSIRDFALMAHGRNQVLESYKDSVAQWIADKDLTFQDVEESF